MGQELWGYVDGTEEKPEGAKELKVWNKNNAKLMSWIVSTVEPHIGINLRMHTTAASMWNYLKKLYHREDDSRKYNLSLEISEYTQGTKSVQEYFSGFTNLWLEYNSIVYAKVPPEALGGIRELQENNMRDQFLMKLRPEFETVRGNLMNRKPVPTLDESFQEVIREEQRIFSNKHEEDKQSSVVDMAFAARSHHNSRDIQTIKCYSCQKLGHLAKDCKNKFCRYCKKEGHIITECRRRPQNRGPKAYHTPQNFLCSELS